jgi:hypothetical protein
MMRADWGDMSHLVLPDLVALTELRVPEMWFPVNGQGNTKRAVVSFFELMLGESISLILTIGISLQTGRQEVGRNQGRH